MPNPEQSSPRAWRQDDQRLADAFDDVVRELHPRLASAVFLIVRDVMAAEDIVQDALLATWRQRHAIDIPEGLPPYLFQACRNRALNHVRNSRRRQRTITDDVEITEHVAGGASTADQDLVASDLRRVLHRAIANLAPGAREIFLLSRQRGLTYNEIATLLDVSVKTVETQMSRALRSLREQLRDSRT
ncbi:RNA polymerase sigma-70 factor [Gemmatimonas sp.]|uniref:RNA polymerase sigma-70 factor n=1 Tax=Gemmatimonas sp. TaxID=1962908 RepID=UPI00333EC27F